MDCVGCARKIDVPSGDPYCDSCFDFMRGHDGAIKDGGATNKSRRCLMCNDLLSDRERDRFGDACKWCAPQREFNNRNSWR